VPEVAVLSPVEGTDLATTTVTFTWEATAGTQTNASARETQGIAGYVVAFADRDGNWASATVNDGNTKTYATDTLAYGQDYSWHVKAIGANGKSATTTPDATFTTTYRLRSLGTEGIVYSLEDDDFFAQYVVNFDTSNLPERFDGVTDFQLTVNGTKYVFEQNEFVATQYNVQIPYNAGTPNDPTMDDVRDGFFQKSPAVAFVQGETTGEYDTIAEAVAAVDADGGQATITLNKAAYSFTEKVSLGSAAPVTILAAEGVTPVITGNDTTGLFSDFTQNSGTVTFIGITFTHGNLEGSGAAVITDNSMNFIDCTFSNNAAGYGGGALYLNWGSFVIQGCQFNDNSGQGNSGGALKCYNDALSIKILESTFTANDAGNGGAVYIGNTDTVEIKDSYFTGNTALNNGGALYLEQIDIEGSGNTDVDISGTTFTSNTATNTNAGDVGYGGALYLKLCSAIEITSAIITGNSADKTGSGIYAHGVGGLNVTTHSCLTTDGNLWSRGYAYPSNEYIARDFSVNTSGEINSSCVETEAVVVKSNTGADDKQFGTGNDL